MCAVQGSVYQAMLGDSERIVAGNGKLEDLDLLGGTGKYDYRQLLRSQRVALPVVSTLKLFRAEYVEHVVDKKCVSHTCTALRRYIISPERCKDVPRRQETVRWERSAEESKNRL